MLPPVDKTLSGVHQWPIPRLNSLCEVLEAISMSPALEASWKSSHAVSYAASSPLTVAGRWGWESRVRGQLHVSACDPQLLLLPWFLLSVTVFEEPSCSQV